MANCILCSTPLTVLSKIDSTLIYSCKCPNCGDYEISWEALEDLPEEFKRRLLNTQHLISGYIFEQNANCQPKVRILNSNIDDIVKNAKLKATLEHKLDRLLLYIYSKTNFFGNDIDVNKRQTAICYAVNRQEVQNLCTALKELGYIDVDFWGQDIARCKLKTSGYAYINEKTKTTSRNKQCFVAMWFDETMIVDVSPYISKAIEDSGFKPFISVNQEHNDDICDSIVAGIKNSRFLIADFTGQRPSVYFEAGLALGIGIPVIWTCREDWFHDKAVIKKEVIVEGNNVVADICDEGHVHFDVNHYKFIVWRDGEDLYKRLKDRIEATI